MTEVLKPQCVTRQLFTSISSDTNGNKRNISLQVGLKPILVITKGLAHPVPLHRTPLGLNPESPEHPGGKKKTQS